MFNFSLYCLYRDETSEEISEERSIAYEFSDVTYTNDHNSHVLWPPVVKQIVLNSS